MVRARVPAVPVVVRAQALTAPVRVRVVVRARVLVDLVVAMLAPAVARARVPAVPVVVRAQALGAGAGAGGGAERGCWRIWW